MEILYNREAVMVAFRTASPTLHAQLSIEAPDGSPLRARIIAALSEAAGKIGDAFEGAGIDIAIPKRDGEWKTKPGADFQPEQSEDADAARDASR